MTENKQSDDLIGVCVGNHRVVRKLGEGASGLVYEARNRFVEQRRVAIKLMHTAVTEDDELWKRFCREAETLDKLDSPHIVRVIDFGRTEEGRPYLIMEFAEGRTLREVLVSEGMLGVSRSLHILKQIVEGLRTSHAAGIVHRDLKPENVLLASTWSTPSAPTSDAAVTPGEDSGGQRDHVRIVDFGIAKGPVGESSIGFETRAGVAIGTPYYMAPEQIRDSKTVDAKADIYALGVIAYEMLTGQRPLTGNTREEVLANTLFQAPPDLRQLNPAAPEELVTLVHQALKKVPEQRQANMESVSAQLSAATVAMDRPSQVVNTVDIADVQMASEPGLHTITLNTTDLKSVWSDVAAQGQEEAESKPAVAVAEKPTVSRWALGIGGGLLVTAVIFAAAFGAGGASNDEDEVASSGAEPAVSPTAGAMAISANIETSAAPATDSTTMAAPGAAAESSAAPSETVPIPRVTPEVNSASGAGRLADPPKASPAPADTPSRPPQSAKEPAAAPKAAPVKPTRRITAPSRANNTSGVQRKAPIRKIATDENPYATTKNPDGK